MWGFDLLCTQLYDCKITQPPLKMPKLKGHKYDIIAIFIIITLKVATSKKVFSITFHHVHKNEKKNLFDNLMDTNSVQCLLRWDILRFNHIFRRKPS